MPDSDIAAKEGTLLQRRARVTRRKETRYQCAPATGGSLSVYKDDDEAQHAWILNISRSGIGLLLDSAIEPETVLVIHIQGECTRASRDLLAKVVHCTPHQTGEWLVGCELAQKLAQPDLDALL